MPTITGTFAIQMTGEPPYDDAGGVTLARARFTKQFVGPLTATSTVEMIGARTAIEGSAGYVAVERITGTLDGRRGSFVVLHTGLMDRGARALTITLVPDAATDELVGLTGTMDIQIVAGQHHYTLTYPDPT